MLGAWLLLWGLVALALLLAPIVSLILSIDLRARVRRLEARLQTVEAGGRAREAAPREPAAPAPARPAADVLPLAAPVPPPPEPVRPTPPVPVAPPPPPSPPGEPAAVPARGRPSWSQLEGRLGERWLNRVGVVALVLGIGFFLKYAFDNEWIGPLGRVSVGLLIGIAFLTLGERLQRAAYRIPAQGLVAAGIATLYLSVYAAHAFYQLVAQSSAFAFMVLVTATGIAVALHHDARAIALLAAIGGFLTPIVLSTGRDAAVPLFTYLAVLDAGIVASAYWRRWRELSLVSFAFTHWLYWAWHFRWYVPEKLPVALIAATVFFALFTLVGPLEAARGRAGGRLAALGGGAGLLMLGPPLLYFLAARAILSPAHRTWLGLLCLALATAYLLGGQWAVRALRDGAGVGLFHFAVALAFLTLTFPVQFTDRGVAIAWSVEGAALLWGAFRLGVRQLRLGALAVLGLAGLRWLTMILDQRGHAGVFLADNPAFVSTIVFAAACGLAALVYRRREAEATGWEVAAGPILVLAALGSVALFLTVELTEYRGFRLPRPYVSVLTALVWTVTALPVMELARRDRTRILFVAATLLLIAVGLYSLDVGGWGTLSPAARRPVVNPRFLGGLLIVAAYALYARLAPTFPIASEAGRAKLGAGAAAVAGLYLLWNLSAEIVLMPLEGFSPRDAASVSKMGLSILWTVYALVVMGVGIRRDQAHLRIGAIGLFGLTVAKVFLVDLGDLHAGYRILSFLVLGGVLLLASFLYSRFRGRWTRDTT